MIKDVIIHDTVRGREYLRVTLRIICANFLLDKARLTTLQELACLNNFAL